MKISKRGRSRLRTFLFMMTMSLVMNNPEFKAMHALQCAGEEDEENEVDYETMW